MNELQIDTNEPKDMFVFAKQVVEARITPLNSDGYADYRWRCADGKTIKQVERKTWGELLADTDKVEEQLHRHLSKHPSVELIFLLEGMVEQTTNGSRVLNKQRNGFVSKGREYRTRLSGIYSWLYEIGKYCEVIQTHSLNESSIAIVGMYQHDQKDRHTTLHRHIKSITFHPDPRVVTLMGMAPGVGEVRASALVNKYITPWNILSAGFHGEIVVKDKYDLTQVPGIGKVLVDNMLRAIGRPDV